MNHSLKASGRRAAVVLGVPTLLLTCAVSGSAAPRLAADAVTAAGSPALHTFGPIAVGIPGLDLFGNNEGGAVDLYLPDGSVQVLTEQKLGLIGEDEGTFDRFGSAIAHADLNGDSWPDLVVGAPGNPLDGSTPGHVDVLLGSALGLTAAGATMLPSPAQPGDQFGASVAVSGNTLWVGAPGTDVDGTANTGAVYRYSIAANGQATLQGSTTEATLGIPGTLQANARFGEVLSPSAGGVMVGVPGRDIGSAKDAGQLVRLKLSAANAVTAEIWTQNTPGVPGNAEAGDRFGATVSVNGYLVGVPGEDIGAVKDAGVVQIFRFGDLAEKMEPASLYTQDSRGVPGAVEAGDQFGAAVSVGLFDCQEVFSMAIGSPGEDLGRATNAGSVTLIRLPSENSPPCPARLLRQGRGLPGAAETGDAVGKTLAAVNGDSNLDEDRFDILLIGSPGEDIGTARGGRDTGRATIRSAQGFTQSFGFQGGDRQALGYGSVFGS
jgi:hypothetical protein